MAQEQSGLRVPGASGDLGRDLAGELGGAGGLARAMLVVPGRLDQQPAGVGVPGLGDVPAVLLGTGGILDGVRPR